jgi:hypothetical protein
MPPAEKPDTFYHLAEEPLWNAAVAAICAYEARKYHEERFTRATVDPHALLAIANTFYKGWYEARTFCILLPIQSRL